MQGTEAGAAVQAATGESDVAGDQQSDDGKKKDKKKDKDKKNKKKDKDKKRDKDKQAQTDAEAEDEGEFIGNFSAGDAWGSSKGELGIRGLSFRFLTQTQYRQSFGVKSNNADETYRVPEETLAKSSDGWGLSRLFFGITAEPSKYLHLKMLTDFAALRSNDASKSVKQAYAELRPIPKHLTISAGILKLPFSIHELDPIAHYEFTHAGPTNDFLTRTDFAGRDIGASVTVSPLEKKRYLQVTLGAYRGQAKNENASPLGSIGARVESELFKGIRIGAGTVIQPKTVVDLRPLDTSSKNLLANPADPAYPRAATWKKGAAYGADLTIEQFGLMVRGEAMMGTRVDYDTRYGADQWAAFWAIAAYKFDAGPIKLEPAVRAEYFDTDFKHEGGLYRFFMFALGTHFNSNTKLILEVGRQIVQDNTPVIEQPRPLREVPYNALNATNFTGRLQILL